MRDYQSTGPDLRATENPDISTGDAGGTPIVEDEQRQLTAQQEHDQARAQSAHEVLQVARQIITESTTYNDTAYRAQWQKNLAHFQSRHAAGSKYHSKAYLHRSKAFRPKTRSTVRRIEAAGANAFFSTVDAVTIEPQNHADPAQVVSAGIYEKIMQYRLRERMPYFRFLIGGLQDAQVMGCAIAHNYWKYEEDEFGNVIHDDLKSDLVPVEKFRFHPDADWMDPINASPYLIHEMDMTVDQVRAKMATGEWFDANEGQILTATKDYDATESARDRNQQQAQGHGAISGHMTVTVYKIISREGNTDYCYYTLGTHFLLSLPQPLSELTPGGMRNYSFGVSIIETHKPIPAGAVELYQDLQGVANDQMNQRVDNVRLAMNKRWIVRRGSNMDVRSLMRNVPGGTVFTQDPENDIKEITTQDVTSSAYREQDYLNADLDEISGSFSNSTVNTNRQMNETVGGLELVSGEANDMTEYMLKTFAETFVLDTNRQQLKLIMAYETDATIMVNAMNANLELLQKYGVSQMTDDMLNRDLICKISVGIDATNPARRLQKLVGAATATANMAGLERLNVDEVSKEIWALSGYDDSTRFMKKPDEMQQEGPSPEQQAMQAEAEAQQQSDQMKMQMEAAKLQFEQQKLQVESQMAVMKMEGEYNLKREIAMMEMAAQRQITMQQLEAQLAIESAKITTQRDIAQLNAITSQGAEQMKQRLEVFKVREQSKQNHESLMVQKEAAKNKPQPARA